MVNIDPVRELAALVRQCGSQKAAAESLGISPQYLGELLKGRRDFSERVLKVLGLTRQVRVTREKTA